MGWPTQGLKLELLSGGFMNANVLLESTSAKAVLRISAHDADLARKELAVAEHAKAAGVCVPQLLHNIQDGNRVCSLWECIEGETLEDFLLAEKEVSKELFHDIGAQLGKIHGIEFSSDGFLNSKLEISQDLGDSDKFLVTYMKRVLSDVPEERLSADTKQQLLSLIEREWHQVEASSQRKRLTHFDFNPKNIMLSSTGEFRAILDWEFAMPANALADFGNFFRFTYDYPEFAVVEFEKGYRGVRPCLPENWRASSRLLDLGAMCGFLERKENYDKTFFTARVVIEETLRAFADKMVFRY